MELSANYLSSFFLLPFYHKTKMPIEIHYLIFIDSDVHGHVGYLSLSTDIYLKTEGKTSRISPVTRIEEQGRRPRGGRDAGHTLVSVP